VLSFLIVLWREIITEEDKSEPTLLMQLGLLGPWTFCREWYRLLRKNLVWAGVTALYEATGVVVDVALVVVMAVVMAVVVAVAVVGALAVSWALSGSESWAVSSAVSWAAAVASAVALGGVFAGVLVLDRSSAGAVAEIFACAWACPKLEESFNKFHAFLIVTGTSNIGLGLGWIVYRLFKPV
jgi:hypothetical protein